MYACIFQKIENALPWQKFANNFFWKKMFMRNSLLLLKCLSLGDVEFIDYSVKWDII